MLSKHFHVLLGWNYLDLLSRDNKILGRTFLSVSTDISMLPDSLALSLGIYAEKIKSRNITTVSFIFFLGGLSPPLYYLKSYGFFSCIFVCLFVLLYLGA